MFNLLPVPLALFTAAAVPVVDAVEPAAEAGDEAAVALPVFEAAAAPVEEAHGGSVDASVTSPLFPNNVSLLRSPIQGLPMSFHAPYILHIF